jgi:hypothetical protein
VSDLDAQGDVYLAECIKIGKEEPRNTGRLG